ncbi:MAG: hypothetical protein JKY61_11850 [Planctomycetes bacterium]|nr:hypothetical protein [Planctomycetota bacterium]
MARRRGNMLEAFQVSREKSLQAQEAAEKASRRGALMPSSESVAQRLSRKVKGLKSPTGMEPGPDGLLHVESGVPANATVPGSPLKRPVVDFPEPGAAAIKQQLDKSITLQMGPGGLFVSALALITISFWGGYRIGERHGAEGAGPEQGLAVQQAAWMDLAQVPQGASTYEAPEGLPDPGALLGGGSEMLAAAPGLGAEGQVSAADLAFEDPMNQFTLVVDQHNNNDSGWERALASYHYLQAQGLPAIYPRTRGDVVYLLVGATERRNSLDALLKEVHGLPYLGSQSRTFSMAYSERIENFF